MRTEPEPTEAEPAPPQAWLPLTPRGIAAFASASTGRLLVAQLLMGLLVGLVVAWFLHAAWFPPIGQAIRHLPPSGDIVDGRLQWTNTAPVLLAGNRYLAIVVDPDHTGRAGQVSDLQIEFGRTEAHLSGLLGILPIRYPAQPVIAFNRRDLVPWWGAWSQAVLSCAIAGTAAALLVIWALLAAIYAPVVRVAATLFDRSLTWPQAWRLGGAALMPGALLMAGAIGLYGWSLIDLVRLGFVLVFHLVAGWVFLAVSALCLPRAQATASLKGNPFVGAPPQDTPAQPAKKNPFAS